MKIQPSSGENLREPGSRPISPYGLDDSLNQGDADWPDEVDFESQDTKEESEHTKQDSGKNTLNMYSIMMDNIR